MQVCMFCELLSWDYASVWDIIISYYLSSFIMPLHSPYALYAKLFHKAFNGTATKLWHAILLKLMPDFTNAITTATGLPNLFDLCHEVFVALFASTLLLWVFLFSFDAIVARWGNWQYSTNRLDPIFFFFIINEFDHHLCGRPSSAWAKKAAAFRIISFACLSSLISRSSSAIRAAWLSVLTVTGFCLARCFWCHERRVSGVQPLRSMLLRCNGLDGRP